MAPPERSAARRRRGAGYAREVSAQQAPARAGTVPRGAGGPPPRAGAGALAPWLALVLLLPGASCRSAPEVSAKPAPRPEPRPERWIDANSPDEARRAFAPQSGYLTRVAAGQYEVRGPLPDDVELVGSGAGEVVLHVVGDTLEVQRAALRHLSVRGGRVGLTARGALTLEDVSFSGQRAAAVRVEPTGTLAMTGGSVEGAHPRSSGIVLLGRSAELSRVAFRGALLRAVAVEAGDVRLSDVESLGAAEALHVGGGRAVATRVRAGGGRGPAFAVNDGELTLRDVDVSGHEYAVLAGQRSTLVVDGLRSERAALAAVGLVEASATLSHLAVTRPGSYGAVQSLDSRTRIDDLAVDGATDVAVIARLGSLEARGVRVRGVRGADGTGGDGLMIRDAVADLRDVVVEDAEGSGVVATQVATVSLDGLTCRRCRWGALLVERRSVAKARNVAAEDAREPAVSVPGEAVLELDGLAVRGEGPALWAECAPGARVVLRGELPRPSLLSGRCIEVPPAASAPAKRSDDPDGGLPAERPSLAPCPP